MSKQVDEKIFPIDSSTELAKERTHYSYERTLMAWIRTGLALIGFGMGIIELAQRTGWQTFFLSSRLVGLLFILLGIASVFVAIKENRINHKRLLLNETSYNQKSSLSVRVGYALIIIGILAIIYVVIKISRQ
jgi:putative membrane protein